MELAVNTFAKGLQNDTHPMVQGSDTLSDALNATFITMNGNEVVLLNDMGNRRVDNAYLPAGYEPVGIKEYGGIIYLALYNPITNESLIGSFPSPERKISSEDGSGLGGTLNLDSLLETYQDSNLEIPCIKKDTILVPLTKDTSLHAGDKFVVYIEGSLEDDIKNNLTNYYNIDENSLKIKSPKNKKYTLSLGVLNSLNEFVDVTKTLSRWNGNTLINYTDKNVSDIYKFNDGYFIAERFAPSLEVTLENRQLIAANTYAYKLIGPLYIKALLNHILEFNYNIYGIINSNKKVELWIEGYVTYNCPDGGVSEEIGIGDDKYLSYEEGKLENFVVFDLIINGNVKSPEEDSVFENTTYDVNSNVYNYKIVKHYIINNLSSGNKLNYVIGVRADNNPNPNSKIYLSGLSDKGVIDTSLLGSNTVELSGWRFINNYSDKNSTSTITYTFNAYPKFGETFYDFQFNFTDVKDPTKTISIPSTIYNGKNSLNINWDEFGISPNKLYKVTWKYKISSDPDHFIEVLDDDRWFLTTELFNSCYSPGSSDYIQDYGNPKEGNEMNIFKDKCNIKYSINSEVTDKSLASQTESTGLLISNTLNITLEYITTKNINLSLNPSINYDSSLYPDYISVEDNPRIIIDSVDKEFDGKMEWVNNYPGTFRPDDFNPKFNIISIENNEIKGNLTNYDIYKSEGTNIGNIVNGFISINKFFDEIMETQSSTSLQMTYNTVATDWEDNTGKDDDHYLGAIIGSSSDHPNPDDRNYFKEIKHEEADKVVKFNLKQYIGSVYDSFQAINKRQIFTWSFINDRNNFFISNKPEVRTGKSMYNYARIWWRTSFGNWALFPKVFLNTGNNKIKDFLKLLFNSILNYKFAYYKNTNYSDAGLYRPVIDRSVYNMEYSFNCNIKWKLKTGGNPFSGTVSDIFECTYPEFKGTGLTSTEFSKSYGVESSKIFLSSIENISKLQEANGIDLDTGKLLDSNNETLNPNTFYLEVNGKLEPRSSLPGIEITEAYGEDGKRTLIYNKESKGNPADLYDVSGNDGDNDSVVVYEDMILVRL